MFKTLIITVLSVCYITSYAQDANYVPGEMIVMLKPGTDKNNLIARYSGFSMEIKQPLVEWMNIWLIRFNNMGAGDAAVLRDVRNHPDVSAAQFNHYVELREKENILLTPNDTRFAEQWSMNNTGQTGGTPDADIDAVEAWELSTSGLTALGDSIIVAVIDGGFYLNHADVNFWKNWSDIPGNGIDDDSNGYVDDRNGWNAYTNSGNVTASGTHGTHVSGTVGAIGNNNLGVAGVNWNVKIMPIQGSTGTESVVLIAYGYALKQRKLYNQTLGQKGAFVVSTNSSFGVDYGQPANFPLWCAFYDSLGAAGILSACATANLNINVDNTGDIPTACPSPWMVSVTNTTHTDIKNTGAAYGLNTIDLGAPGTNILSTTTASNYGLSTGTSMATPHVAGAIAFLYSTAPLPFMVQYKLDPDSMALVLRDKMFAGVDTIAALRNSTVTGGRLNLHKAALLMQQTITSNGNYTDITPVNYKLYNNYPNPFNPSTTIRYDVSEKVFVKLRIYDATGREVKTLVNNVKQPGSYEVNFNADGLTSGVYFYKIEAGSFAEVKKMVLIK